MAANTTETSWWDGFLDTVKELGGGFLNYDLKKEEIKSGSTSSTNDPYEPSTSTSSDNNTMLIMGGVIAIVLILVMVKK